MESAYPVWLIPFLVISITISTFLTLAKVVFSNLSAQFKNPQEASDTELKIQEIVDTSAFFEIISLGRLVANSSTAIFAYHLRPFDIISPWPMLGAFVQFFILWIFLYLFIIIIPTVSGNLRPNSLASFSLFMYKIVSLPFALPASFMRNIMKRIYEKVGFKAEHKFLTEDQREMLESDTSASESDSELEDDEKQMIRNIFEFGETPVSEIMTPLSSMLVLAHDTPIEEVIRILNHERHSRLPVFKEDKDDIIGVLHNRDFLQWVTENNSADFKLEYLVKPAMFIPSMKKIDEVLRELRKERSQLAIVVDEYGGTTGLVTLEDIIEEIVGEIQDEDDHDEEAELIKLKGNKYLVKPHINLDDLQSGLGIKIEVPDDSHVETLSGLIQNTLGSIPTKGTVVDFENFKVRVIRVEDTRMVKLLIELKTKND